MDVEIVAMVLWIVGDLWLALDATNTDEDVPRRTEDAA